MISFNKGFDRLIKSEGGYVNDPEDPGGETNWGISKRSYPHLNIKDLTREEAKEIYRVDFWEAVGDSVHSAIKYQVFDFAVNSGISTAIRKLQSAIGVADDGHWGPRSDAVARAMDHNDILMRFIAERLDFWRKLKNWPRFGAGWVARAADQLRYAAEDNDDVLPNQVVTAAQVLMPDVTAVVSAEPEFRFIDPNA